MLTRAGFWSAYLVVALLWAVANLVAYWRRTRPGCQLGRIGSLSVWAWDVYVAFAIVGGAVHRPFGLDVPTLARVFALMLVLAGGALAVRGMLEFQSLARISGLHESRLVSNGVYARMRHPQVGGLLLVAFGFSMAAGTLVGLLAAVVFLLWSLIQMRLEDRRLVLLFGDEARRYIARVPAYLPRLRGRTKP